MEAAVVRSTWTDERLEDFREHVDPRFDAIDRRFEAVDQRFDAVDRRLEAVDKRLERIENCIVGQNARIDGIHRSITTFATALVASFGAIAATLFGLLITQI